ncbi:hypothetical protein BDZ89DRAFT_1150980 [Hymenopellis radicata]|nr:hypothetical protein BDZ89DRAFT_1150980 [Hymenopellis radicata]
MPKTTEAPALALARLPPPPVAVLRANSNLMLDPWPYPLRATTDQGTLRRLLSIRYQPYSTARSSYPGRVVREAGGFQVTASDLPIPGVPPPLASSPTDDSSISVTAPLSPHPIPTHTPLPSTNLLEQDSTSRTSLVSEPLSRMEDPTLSASTSRDSADNSLAGFFKVRLPRPPGRMAKNQLFKELTWDKATADKFDEFVEDMAKTKLQVGECYENQSDKSLAVVVQLVRSEFPQLDNYDGDWPLHVLLMTKCKKSAARQKNKHNNSIVSFVESAGAISARSNPI